MSISGLTLIAEAINDSVPSTHQLYEEGNIEAIVELARFQAEHGAAYIDVNIGVRPPTLMAELVRQIQKTISLPLAIDAPDIEIAAAGLEAYDVELAEGRMPILNSITEARLEMFDLYRKKPFIPILLISEGKDENGIMIINKTAEQTYHTAKTMVQKAREYMDHATNQQIILDPGIVPIGSDMEGNFPRLIQALELIHRDEDLAHINISVGLSNFTNMLPNKKADGSPVRAPLENAFLTLAMPLGLNFVIGSVRRNYEILSAHHPAVQCLRDTLQLRGVEAIMRVMSFLM